MPTDYAHLPNLPDAGYATRRQKELSDAIMLFMRDIERDRLRLLTIVIEGAPKWRKVAMQAWRGLRVDDEILDAMYVYFCLQAAPPDYQLELLAVQKNPVKWREIMRRLIPQLESDREMLKLIRKWQ